MSMRSALLNLVWLIFGGLGVAVGWGIAAVIMAVTIIGIPWARAAINIAVYTLLPFGQKAVARDQRSMGSHHEPMCGVRSVSRPSEIRRAREVRYILQRRYSMLFPCLRWRVQPGDTRS